MKKVLSVMVEEWTRALYEENLILNNSKYSQLLGWDLLVLKFNEKASVISYKMYVKRNSSKVNCL